MVAPNFDYEIPDTLDFSGVGEQTSQIRLPKVNFQRIKLQWSYKVVDAGITAGENISGAITRALFQTPGFKITEPLDIRTDEMTEVYPALLGESTQPVAQMVFDSTPTTNTDTEAWFVLDWGYNGAKMADNAVLTITMDPSSEWGAASTFTGTCRVFLELGEVAETEYVYRLARTASTSDDVPAPSTDYASVLITTETAGDLTYLNVPNGPEYRNPDGASNNWSLHVQETASATDSNYFIVVDAIARTDTLRIEAATSEVRTVFYVSNIGWTGVG